MARELVVPEERFDAGMIRVPGLPGFGIELNENLARAHPV